MYQTYTKLTQFILLGLLTIMIFASVISTAVLEISAALLFIFYLIGGCWQQKIAILKTSRMAQIALILFAYMGIRAIETSGSHHEALRTLSAYSKLLVIPIIIWLMSEYPKFQKWITTIFMIAMTIVITLGYIKFYFGVHYPIGDKPTLPAAVFIGHITSSFFVSIGLLIISTKLFFSTEKSSNVNKLLWTILFIFYIHYLLFMTIGRSGYVTTAVFMTYLLCRLMCSKQNVIKIIILIGLCSCAGILALKFSSTFNHRVTMGLNNVTAFEKGKIHTSWGERLFFWKNSLKAIEHSPFFGTGTGSFDNTYKQITRHDKQVDKTTNPHEQYLYITLEQGAVGLVLFLMLLYFTFQARQEKGLSHQKLIREGLTLGFAIGCLYNSWLHDVHEGFLALILLAATQYVPLQKGNKNER